MATFQIELSDEEEWEAFEDKMKTTRSNTPLPCKNTSNASDSKPDKRDLKSEESDSKSEVYKPESSDSELKIKPACECQYCRHWTTSVDWLPTPNLKFEEHDSKTSREKKAEPLLRTEKKTVSKICSYESHHSNKLAEFRTLVHGKIIPDPVDLLKDCHFHPSLHSSLEKLNYKYSKPIQSFVYPAIFRRLNVFMVGSRKSGKTMAYLPAVCTFAFQEEEKYRELAKYKGPLIIIVCPNSKQCEEILDLIKKLYSNIHIKLKVSIMTYPLPNMIQTDILIILPESLVYCLKSRIFNLKRLCHLVFEDTSSMLKNNGESIWKILNVANEMLTHRVGKAKVQLIVTSEKWTTEMKKLLEKINMTPLLCIGDNLEAALYGNIQFQIKFLMSEQKKTYVEGFLKDHYHIYKTLIICDDSEIVDLNKWLVRNGIETMALSDNSSKEDIDECEVLWRTLPSGRNKVLLCTDFIFGTLISIKDAVWLVHYNFPSTWTKFSLRFSALSSHLKSPLVAEDDTTKIRCRSYLLIDETCEHAMPRILNLLSRLSTDLPLNYQQYAEGFKIKLETEKIAKETPFCEKIKLFGKCPNPLCEDRHLVDKDLDVSNSLPKNGKITFKILALKDVTRYVIQLREHTNIDGKIRRCINTADLKQPLIFNDKKKAQNLEVGKFYVHCDHTTDGDVYMLCQLLKIENDTFVEVKLTTGVTLQALKTKLYDTPTDLEIVEVYMCNLVPPFKDEHFSGRSFHVTRTSLESIEYKDIVFTADIFLQLDRTFWIDNVVEIVKTSDSAVVKFDLSKHLRDLKVVESNKTPLKALYKLCEKCEIPLPEYTPKPVKKAAKVKELDPQQAFLSGVDEVILSSAISPDEFYIRLYKFQPLLENLEKELKELVRKEILDRDVEVTVGKYYLALDPHQRIYSRVKVLKIEKKRALCFYVDYGDEAVKYITELKKLPTKYITKLPFQAIQCRLHGLTASFDEWDDEATDVLYKYMFEPDSDVYRGLFVKVCQKEKSDNIRTKEKYSVLLKDGYGSKNILINQLMIDCGFATSAFGKVDDFELPSSVQDSAKFEDNSNGEDDLEDLEIFDEDEFLELFCPFPLAKKPSLPQIESKNEAQNSNIKSTSSDEHTTAEEPPKYLTPEVFWSQDEKTVTLKIKLIGVEQYQVNVIRKKIFSFSANVDNKAYGLKFTLHKLAELGKHGAKGQEVRVVLNKSEALDWKQLTGTNKRLRNVHYEITEEKEEPRKKFLQLDITDDESDCDDDVMYDVVSDLDSEFDDEVKSSDSD